MQHTSSWQLIFESVLPVDAGADEPNAEAILALIAAGRDLGLPAALQRTIQASIEKASKEANKQGRSGPALPVTIRLYAQTGFLLNGQAENFWQQTTLFPDENETAPDPGKLATAESIPADNLRPGWGCFLVERLAGSQDPSADDAHYVIELFLYTEGDSSAEP